MQFPQFFCQRHISVWAANCQESNPSLRQNFQPWPFWPISQTLRWKMLSLHVYATILFCMMMNCHFPMDKFHFFSKNPKCQFILFQHTNVHLCAKFGDLKPTVDEKQRPWTCFWARHTGRNKIQQGNCNFLSTKCFINVNQSSGSTECAVECLKPRVMLWDQRRDPPSKNWGNLNFSSDSALLLAFSSQQHTMWS